jgi:hypothetical protein
MLKATDAAYIWNAIGRCIVIIIRAMFRCAGLLLDEVCCPIEACQTKAHADCT